MKKAKDKIKSYRLDILNKQKQFYMREIQTVKETNEEYFVKQKLNKDKLIENLWQSINSMIALKNSPNSACVDIGVVETNKMVKNVIDLKLALERGNEGEYSEKKW